MTTFFERQDEARRRTALLVALFVGFGLALVLGLYTLLVLLGGSHAGAGWWRPRLMGQVAGWTALVIGGGGLWRVLTLKRGGEAVAALLHARPVRWEDDDPARRRLLNVVEEMAIASGLPAPDVYVMPSSGINALAVGRELEDAAVVVTEGALAYLARDELQGVVAHEFSHILNGDIRLKLRVIGLLYGLMAFALAGYRLLEASERPVAGPRGAGDGGAGVALLILLGPVLALVGGPLLLAARVIKGAVMRQRERLADASAVQFTRHPAGLAGALKKIGGHPAGGEAPRAQKEECSHLFAAPILAPGLFSAGLFGSHPPLMGRIRRLDPSFDGAYEIPLPLPHPLPHPLAEGAPAEQEVPAAGGRGAASRQAVHADPELIAGQVGHPSDRHLAHGAAVRVALPEALVAAAHEPLGAVALVCGLLLDADDAVRRKQLAALRQHAARAVCEETERLQATLRDLAPEARLPLLEVAAPALRRLSARQYAAFWVNCSASWRPTTAAPSSSTPCKRSSSSTWARPSARNVPAARASPGSRRSAPRPPCWSRRSPAWGTPTGPRRRRRFRKECGALPRWAAAR